MVLVGQTETVGAETEACRHMKPIRQRIDMNIVLEGWTGVQKQEKLCCIPYDIYAGAGKEIFTSGAEDEVDKISAGIRGMINRVCEKGVMLCVAAAEASFGRTHGGALWQTMKCW